MELYKLTSNYLLEKFEKSPISWSTKISFEAQLINSIDNLVVNKENLLCEQLKISNSIDKRVKQIIELLMQTNCTDLLSDITEFHVKVLGCVNTIDAQNANE